MLGEQRSSCRKQGVRLCDIPTQTHTHTLACSLTGNLFLSFVLLGYKTKNKKIAKDTITRESVLYYGQACVCVYECMCVNVVKCWFVGFAMSLLLLLWLPYCSCGCCAFRFFFLPTVLLSLLLLLVVLLLLLFFWSPQNLLATRDFSAINTIVTKGY